MAKIVIRVDLNNLMTRSRYCFGARWSSGPSGAEENGAFNTSVDNLPVLACVRAQSGRLSTLNLYAGENPRSFYTDGVARISASPERLQLLEHSGATGEHIAVGGIEITGVPGVGYVAGAIGPIEQARDLAIGVLAKDAV